ncbi:MAG: protein kinase, partial [Acidimicrobiia bacterium]
MATVYLAHDLKHDRPVAVKVLRPELAAVLGAERFIQEIKTTANLQHPHILPLHDSGNADGFLYYVMPFIDGETLRDKLNRETQLGIEEAVGITTNIADALDYAHRNNVIHRDIKPENILLHDGRPMVADFGIALALSAAAGGRMTETGMSLGTPHYMSPEQATAEKDLTNRSDIYSLGCVLYEMLTGDPPHTGSSAQQIIMKIVAEDVQPVTELRKSVPPNVAAAVAKTLEKLAADRFGTAKEFAEALTNPAFTLPLMEPRPGGGRSRVWLVLPWAVAATLGAVAATAVVIMQVRGPAASTDAPRSWNIALPDSAPMVFVGEGTFGIGFPALDISPDGSLIVYVGQTGGTTQLFVRPTDGFDVRALPGTTGAFHPFFSPDGQEIAFFADDQLKRIPVEGGNVSVVTDAPDAAGGSWSEDDEIVASIQDGSALIVVRPTGLERRVFRGFGSGSPQWLPGGEWVLQQCDQIYLCAFLPESEEVRFLTANGDPVALPEDGAVLRGWNPRFLSNGYLLYGAGGQNVMLAVRFDPGTLATSGQPTQVLGGLRREAFSGGLHVATSLDGTLVFAEGIDAALGELVWVDGEGVEETLPFPPQLYGAFSLSPDGRRVAAPVTTGAGVRQLWFFDLQRARHQVWAGDYSA